ncbi:MAG TPA: hypothetical protein VJK06_08135 [Methyloceanibacter sp.]|nr:hypothetical protein [Methyloceanibacter sp.]
MTASTLRLESDPHWADDLGDQIPASLLALASDPGDDATADATPQGAHRILAVLQSEMAKSIATAREAQLQALIHDFRKRQRDANLLVAASLVSACLLTVLGFATAMSFAKPQPEVDNPTLIRRATSVAWQRPLQETKGDLLFIATAAPASGRSPLLIDAALHAGADPAPQVVLAEHGRQLALAPLLPRRQARYLLIRGLPDDAKLSAGLRNTSGGWMVRNEDVGNLTLTFRGTEFDPGMAPASGDYPLEVYVLGDETAPQARRNFILRVDANASDREQTAMNWSSALLDLAVMSMPPENISLLTRAETLLDQGDIASARLLLRHLADRGVNRAAFELARTFDADVLASLNVRGVSGDKKEAKLWYERAAGIGNVAATERLKILASLAD